MRPLPFPLLTFVGCGLPAGPVDLHDAAAEATELPWLPWSEGSVEGLRSQLVVVLVSADWDLHAQRLERTVFGDPAVRACLDDVHAVPVLLDVTRGQPEALRWLDDRGLFEPHVYVIPPDGAGPTALWPAQPADLLRALGCG